MKLFTSTLIFLTLVACSEKKSQKIYLGVDLSYVNEMVDCGGKFRDNGKEVNPYELFANKGANLSRIRLWHNPTWTEYSDFEDVRKAIEKSKNAGMEILLDFHYSDTWADPGKQLIPLAWKGVRSLEVLGDSVYQYTYNTLRNLHNLDLLPEMVQVGNETNAEILMELHAENYDSINWKRNIFLINKGIQAVDDFSADVHKEIETMIHIAQPENAEWWFPLAFENHILPFDWIGLSYYPKWSEYSMDQLVDAMIKLKSDFKKPIIVVETAYPYSLDNIDSAGNILGKESLIPGFPATPEGQKSYMITLTRNVLIGGGSGVIYWEPAWISTDCSTLWGKGSHWDNATFFDGKNQNEALEVFDFYDLTNYENIICQSN